MEDGICGSSFHCNCFSFQSGSFCRWLSLSRMFDCAQPKPRDSYCSLLSILICAPYPSGLECIFQSINHFGGNPYSQVSSHSSVRQGILYLVMREDRHSDLFLKDTPLSDNLAVTPHLIRSCRVCVLTLARGGIAPYATWRTRLRSAMPTARSGRPPLHNRKAKCKSPGIALNAPFNTSVWRPES